MTDVIPLHEMPIDEVIANYEGHPSADHISISNLRAYVKAAEEYFRAVEHEKDLTNRSRENLEVIETCISFLHSKGVLNEDIPDE